MSEQGSCATLREHLPDFAAGRLSDAERRTVEAHLAGCAECREELELVSMLFSTRARVPEGLHERVVDALADGRRAARRRPAWALSAAAVAAIALGIGVATEPRTETGAVADEIAGEYEEGEFWVSDDGMVAGAPSLDGLSDAALIELLEELASETSGGAA